MGSNPSSQRPSQVISVVPNRRLTQNPENQFELKYYRSILRVEHRGSTGTAFFLKIPDGPNGQFTYGIIAPTQIIQRCTRNMLQMIRFFSKHNLPQFSANDVCEAENMIFRTRDPAYNGTFLKISPPFYERIRDHVIFLRPLNGPLLESTNVAVYQYNQNEGKVSPGRIIEPLYRRNFILHDAQTSEGALGAPVLDTKGNLIAMQLCEIIRGKEMGMAERMEDFADAISQRFSSSPAHNPVQETSENTGGTITT